MTHLAVNWNKQEDYYSSQFFDQNTKQFWLEKEIAVSDDIDTWNSLTPDEKETYRKVLAGLTLLDTRQGGNGMPLLTLHAPNDQQRSVFAFMGAMEEIHAKSYSHIFLTLLSKEQIEKTFDWVHENEYAQKKADIIISYYNGIFKPNPTKREIYMALVASICLESYLFYSGFFYPLYLSGQGKLTASGEIISLIVRDEAVHGLFAGRVAQDIYEELAPEEQVSVDAETMQLIDILYQNEVLYTKELYDKINLTEDVLAYVRYNANRALLNLGKDPVFPEEEVNPIVLNGIRTDTVNHDFFSTKGNGYVKALNVKPLTDASFDFSGRI